MKSTLYYVAKKRRTRWVKTWWTDRDADALIPLPATRAKAQKALNAARYCFPDSDYKLVSAEDAKDMEVSQ